MRRTWICIWLISSFPSSGLGQLLERDGFWFGMSLADAEKLAASKSQKLEKLPRPFIEFRKDAIQYRVSSRTDELDLTFCDFKLGEISYKESISLREFRLIVQKYKANLNLREVRLDGSDDTVPPYNAFVGSSCRPSATAFSQSSP